MAEKQNRFAENVPGKFYVDDQCIGCDLCTVEVPGHFEMNEDLGHAYVRQQPTTSEDTEACENALESCPVEAIGDDGEVEG